MAELCSALPTSGGMYHWSAELGGPTWAWFTDWLNIVGLITAIAGIDYECSEKYFSGLNPVPEPRKACPHCRLAATSRQLT
jgi:amino acid transporter